MKDKKAAGKIISVYWFAILIIVAGGVFAISNNLYGHALDIREVEADILADRVADCLSEKGFLRESVFDDQNFLINSTNVLDKCNLNFDVDSQEQVPQYYIEIDFSGTKIYPGNMQHYYKSVQFQVGLLSGTGNPDDWDPSNDYSFQGITEAFAISENIPVYNAGVHVFGL